MALAACPRVRYSVADWPALATAHCYVYVYGYVKAYFYT